MVRIFFRSCSVPEGRWYLKERMVPEGYDMGLGPHLRGDGENGGGLWVSNPPYEAKYY